MKVHTLVTLLVTTVCTFNAKAQDFKTIKIRNRTWMAENLSTDAHGSCCYNYSQEQCNKYGKLYTWDAAQKACPSGWHLPSESEWDELITYLGGEDQAGAVLKAGGSSGFNALLAGLSDTRGFSLLGFCGGFWSSTPFDKTHAWYYYLNNRDGSVTKTYFSTSYGFSVRCIKN